MGNVCNRMTILQHYNEYEIRKIREKAIFEWKLFFPDVDMDIFISPILETVYNCYYSFVISGDGSKDGWNESNKAEKFRKRFIDMIIKTHPGVDIVVLNISEYSGAYIEYRFPDLPSL